METNPEKIRELRRKQPRLTCEQAYAQIERHLGRPVVPASSLKSLDLESGPKLREDGSTRNSG